MGMIKEGTKIKVTGFNCGEQCKSKFTRLGIIEGKIISILHIQPMGGPVVVSLDSENNDIFSIGHGMMEKLKYEVIK